MNNLHIHYELFITLFYFNTFGAYDGYGICQLPLPTMRSAYLMSSSYNFILQNIKLICYEFFIKFYSLASICKGCHLDHGICFFPIPIFSMWSTNFENFPYDSSNNNFKLCNNVLILGLSFNLP